LVKVKLRSKYAYRTSNIVSSWPLN
jgi:hypothetical protein